MSHSDGTTKGGDARVGFVTLGELVAFCREFGVMRLVYRSGEQSCELTLGDLPEAIAPTERAEPKSPEEQIRDTKRAKLRRVLGREPTPFELENLP